MGTGAALTVFPFDHAEPHNGPRPATATNGTPAIDAVLADWAIESDCLASLVTDLDESGWRTMTPATGWDIATTIAHLATTDNAALATAAAGQTWAYLVAEASTNPHEFTDAAAKTEANRNGEEILRRWHASRTALSDVLRTLPRQHKLPWFGPPMSPTSMATARLMETWAHGVDVADALRRETAPTDRLRHIAHLGCRTRDFAFRVNGLHLPEAEFRVELSAPSGRTWTWGPEDADQQVTGSALHFCLLVTQRRHREDLALIAIGADANRWLDIAQAFAGPNRGGRAPQAFERQLSP